MKEKKCLECQKQVRGRSDKRFCDDSCRNTYNNRLNNVQNTITRTINNILRKNRKILMCLLVEGNLEKLSIERMKLEGFNFDYHTHTLITSEGKRYVFIYDYGYLILANEACLIVKQKQT